MIFVELSDSSGCEFPDATRFSTDEHNNLEIWSGKQGDRLIQVFACGKWRNVGVDDDSED